MKKEAIFSEKAPRPIGPYSQAIKIDNWLFLSGQIPIVPQTNEVLAGDIKEQTRQVLENIQAVLSANGATLKDIIKTTVYLTDLAEFSAMNEVYSSYFSAPYPARTTVQVANLPKGVKIEIDAIAYCHGHEKEGVG